MTKHEQRLALQLACTERCIQALREEIRCLKAANEEVRVERDAADVLLDEAWRLVQRSGPEVAS